MILESLEESLQLGLNILENFTSPISDSYPQIYFKKKLKEILKKMLFNLKYSDKLYNPIEIQLQDINHWDETSRIFNFQLSSVEKLGTILESTFMYSRVLALFIPLKFSIKFSFKDSIKDKIDDIRKVFNNLFVYILGLENLDKQKLVSFLLKATMENKLSEFFFELSMNIQKITP